MERIRKLRPKSDTDRRKPVKAKKATIQSAKKKVPMSEFSAEVGRALRLAAKDARKTARMYGTPIIIVRDGKVVAEKP